MRAQGSQIQPYTAALVSIRWPHHQKPTASTGTIGKLHYVWLSAHREAFISGALAQKWLTSYVCVLSSNLSVMQAGVALATTRATHLHESTVSSIAIYISRCVRTTYGSAHHAHGSCSRNRKHIPWTMYIYEVAAKLFYVGFVSFKCDTCATSTCNDSWLRVCVSTGPLPLPETPIGSC